MSYKPLFCFLTFLNSLAPILLPYITTVNIVLCVVSKQLVLALSGMLCSVGVPEEQRPQLHMAET
jgi:hypothetical protein